jgi:hypothetical protein
MENPKSIDINLHLFRSDFPMLCSPIPPAPLSLQVQERVVDYLTADENRLCHLDIPDSSLAFQKKRKRIQGEERRSKFSILPDKL